MSSNQTPEQDYPSEGDFIRMQKNHRDSAHTAHPHDDSKIMSNGFCTCICCATPLLKKGYLVGSHLSMICAPCFLLPTK